MTRRVLIGSKRPPRNPLFPVEKPVFGIHADLLGYQVHVLSLVQCIKNAGSGEPTGTSRKYQEQAVDEVLQLRLYEAILAADVVPPGATIVLATGDGNAGEFGEDGFLGCVGLALERGGGWSCTRGEED